MFNLETIRFLFFFLYPISLCQHNLDIVDRYGNNPLHHAVSQYQPCQRIIDLLERLGIRSIPQLLLEKASKHHGYIDRQNNEGDTVLHISLRNGHTSLVQLLLSKGAKVNILNNKDELPLDVAINVYQNQDIDYLPIIKDLIDRTKDEMIEGCLEKASPILRELIDCVITPIRKNPRSADSRQEEEVEEVEEEVKQEEEKILEESVPRKESLNSWKEVEQQLGMRGWGKYPFLKQDGKYTGLDWITKNDNPRSDNVDIIEDILTKGNDLSNLYIHKVFDELGDVPTDYYHLGFAPLTLHGTVLLNE